MEQETVDTAEAPTALNEAASLASAQEKILSLLDAEDAQPEVVEEEQPTEETESEPIEEEEVSEDEAEYSE